MHGVCAEHTADRIQFEVKSFVSVSTTERAIYSRGHISAPVEEAVSSSSARTRRYARSFVFTEQLQHEWNRR